MSTDNMPMLTYPEAAEILGITIGTLRGAVTAGKIRSIKVPGDRKKYFRQVDVANYRQGAYYQTPSDESTPKEQGVISTGSSLSDVGQYVADQAEALTAQVRAEIETRTNSFIKDVVPIFMSMIERQGMGTSDDWHDMQEASLQHLRAIGLDDDAMEGVTLLLAKEAKKGMAMHQPLRRHIMPPPPVHE